jgi:hypothetical protein
MIVDWNVIFSVFIGGVLTLLGSLLANYLQYRTEKRNWKKERITERHGEVRKYMAYCLDFVDMVSKPNFIVNTWGVEKITPASIQWINNQSRELLNKINTLPVKGSSRVLYIDDDEIRKTLESIDGLLFLFTMSYDKLFEKGIVLDLEDKRSELKKLAEIVNKRLDYLVDKL